MKIFKRWLLPLRITATVTFGAGIGRAIVQDYELSTCLLLIAGLSYLILSTALEFKLDRLSCDNYIYQLREAVILKHMEQTTHGQDDSDE